MARANRLARAFAAEATCARLHSAIFDAAWTETRDISDDAVLGSCLEAAGVVAGDWLSAAASVEAEAALAANLEAAEAAGVFGVPSMLLESELYWGLDALPILEWRATSAWTELAPLSDTGYSTCRDSSEVPERAAEELPVAFKLVNSKSAKHSIVWLACVLLSAPAFGQSGDAGEPTSYDAEQIRRLIMRSGAGELGVQLLSIVEQQIIATLLEANPELPSEAGPIVRATVGEVLGGDISGLVTRMIPSYAAAFSPEEVDALVAFYDSPAGSKLRAQLPTLMRASMGEGQRWVNEHRADLDALLKRRLDTAGIDLPD